MEAIPTARPMHIQMSKRDQFLAASEAEQAVRIGEDQSRQEEAREADIRTAAYFLWEKRGRGHGFDKSDWFAAQYLLSHPDVAPRPVFQKINAALILSNLAISHCGLHEFFCPSHSWIEIKAHPKMIFAWDSNRRLHFDEGFLGACHRIFKNPSIIHIDPSHHFPYRDLKKFRARTYKILSAYRRGADLLPPLFFYSSPYQFEILDGVHRCLAAFELAQTPAAGGGFFCSNYRIWLGVNHHQFPLEVIARQIWICSLSYIETQ